MSINPSCTLCQTTVKGKAEYCDECFIKTTHVRNLVNHGLPRPTAVFVHFDLKPGTDANREAMQAIWHN